MRLSKMLTRVRKDISSAGLSTTYKHYFFRRCESWMNEWECQEMWLRWILISKFLNASERDKGVEVWQGLQILLKNSDQPNNEPQIQAPWKENLNPWTVITPQRWASDTPLSPGQWKQLLSDTDFWIHYTRGSYRRTNAKFLLC